MLMSRNAHNVDGPRIAKPQFVNRGVLLPRFSGAENHFWREHPHINQQFINPGSALGSRTAAIFSHPVAVGEKRRLTMGSTALSRSAEPYGARLSAGRKTTPESAEALSWGSSKRVSRQTSPGVFRKAGLGG